MTTLVTDAGFQADDWTGGFLSWNDVEDDGTGVAQGSALDIPNTLSAKHLQPFMHRLALIRIDFPSSADGRGFSIARHLRLLGYQGRLRARGHVLADQYAMARRCGFDEVEIDQELAVRQPAEQWLARADWRSHDYQNRLRKGA
jgi:uncharacterized protein (DUF934 family)